MSDPIRISELSDIQVSNLGREDQIIINDVTVGGGTPITRKTSLDTFLGFIEGEDLDFTGDVSFESITPGIGGLNATVDSIHINNSLSFSSTVDIGGIRVEDLENVVLGGVPLKAGQVLGYNGGGNWVNMNVASSGGGGGGDTIIGVEDVTATGIYGRRIGRWEQLNDLAPPTGTGLYGYNAGTSSWQVIPTGLEPPTGNGIYAYDGANGVWIDISSRLTPETPEETFLIIYDDSQRPGTPGETSLPIYDDSQGPETPEGAFLLIYDDSQGPETPEDTFLLIYDDSQGSGTPEGAFLIIYDDSQGP